ncbi:uncharacterized protein Dsimw501_GD28414 [Drosophila simulans]|nr:uncharacterized protein Dsimw501_GD28414 [Drosophila simulans]
MPSALPARLAELFVWRWSYGAGIGYGTGTGQLGAVRGWVWSLGWDATQIPGPVTTQFAPLGQCDQLELGKIGGWYMGEAMPQNAVLERGIEASII